MFSMIMENMCCAYRPTFIRCLSINPPPPPPPPPLPGCTNPQSLSLGRHVITWCHAPPHELVHKGIACASYVRRTVLTSENLETPQGRARRDQLDHCASIHPERMIRRIGMSRDCTFARACARFHRFHRFHRKWEFAMAVHAFRLGPPLEESLQGKLP